MILVISDKQVYAATRFIEEANRQNIGLKVLCVEDLIAKNFDVDVFQYQALYVRNPYVKGRAGYLPQIINLAKKFKAAGKKVVDTTIAEGNLGQGKWADYRALMRAGLPIPKTRMLSDCSLTTVHCPLILKWTYGFKGKHTYFVKNELEFHLLAKKYSKDELLLQEFVNAEYEYKVITVGYKALPVVLRFAINPKTHRPDFKQIQIINVGNGLDRSLQRIIDISQRASELLGRELAKVDILEAKGQFYILEVNRFPGLQSFEKFTKHNVARAFLDYLHSQ